MNRKLTSSSNFTVVKERLDKESLIVDAYLKGEIDSSIAIILFGYVIIGGYRTGTRGTLDSFRGFADRKYLLGMRGALIYAECLIKTGQHKKAKRVLNSILDRWHYCFEENPVLADEVISGHNQLSQRLKFHKKRRLVYWRQMFKGTFDCLPQFKLQNPFSALS